MADELTADQIARLFAQHATTMLRGAGIGVTVEAWSDAAKYHAKEVLRLLATAKAKRGDGTPLTREGVARTVAKWWGGHIWPGYEAKWEHSIFLKLADAILALSPPPAPAPAGWKLVPIEPSSQQLADMMLFVVGHEPSARDFAKVGAVLELLPPTGHPDARNVIADMVRDYRAMISAAPVHPEGGMK